MKYLLTEEKCDIPEKVSINVKSRLVEVKKIIFIDWQILLKSTFQMLYNIKFFIIGKNFSKNNSNLNILYLILG